MVWLSWLWQTSGVLTGYVLTVLACVIWRFRGGSVGFLRDATASLFVATYVPLFASFAALLVEPHDGAQRVLTFLIVVVCSDTGGYATGVWLGNDDDTGTSLSGGAVPTQIWSDFMAKAHEGLPPSNLPDASTAAVPATQLQPSDQISQMIDGTSQPVDPNARAQPQQPVTQQPPPKRTAKTIGDMLSGLFGGGG